MTRMTRRRGTGGGGRGVNWGSGEGVRERLKRFSFGMSEMERVKWCDSGGDADICGGALASVIADADSARNLSPIL